MYKKYHFCLSLMILYLSPITHAENLIWRGDFETGDLSQWSYLLNKQGLSAQSECTYEGKWAGKVTITGGDDFLWYEQKHLNRTEFEYKPLSTPAGSDTFFGWSFYLPKPFTQAFHELGYWESDQSWQQKMRFNINASTLSFQETTKPQPNWVKQDFVTNNNWHDISMHIHWAANSKNGFVKIWLDGEYVGQETLQTLANEEHGMFIHLGILRHQEPAEETIYIDNARHGNSIESVLSLYDSKNTVNCDL